MQQRMRQQTAQGESPQRPLAGCVAVVTGAGRGAGRGIAVELGEAGATVYVTGRSARHRPAAGYDGLLALSKTAAMPGHIDEVAAEVTRLGGRGIAVRCDHTQEAEVGACVRDGRTRLIRQAS
jgi:NAD(P)-dependent dehydrogenase (short-subunit alcohol dehydrogenase family)